MSYTSRNIVRIGRGNAPSGRALRQALQARGYDGYINWGYVRAHNGLNSAEAIQLASHKKNALQAMHEAGVPIPAPVHPYGYADIHYPVVARTTYHHGGSGFWLCHTFEDIERAIDQGASHCMQFIADAREFRVHIVHGKSIKISEKPKTGILGNHASTGAWFYPHEFERKKSLRAVAKQAVAALGLDFGAVDVLYKDGQFYVTEVNTAPCLTDSQSDTLERYVNAFMAEVGVVMD